MSDRFALRYFAALAFWSLSFALFCAGCTGDGAGLDPTATAFSSVTSDESWVRALRRAHEAADAAHSEPQRERAATQLRALLQQLPQAETPESLWVKQDVHGRLARMELVSGRAAAALGACQTGLALSKEPSVAVANLFLLQGQALEKLNRMDEAIEAYHQALLVNETLMQKSLGEHDEP